MTQDINHVTVTGRLTRDPQCPFTDKCEFTIAINGRTVSQANGEWIDTADFIDVTAKGKLAELCASRLYKGSRVCIDGKLRQETWTKDGLRHSRVKVLAWNVQFMDAPHAETASSPAASTAGLDVPEEDFDSDIPF